MVGVQNEKCQALSLNLNSVLGFTYFPRPPTSRGFTFFRSISFTRVAQKFCKILGAKS